MHTLQDLWEMEQILSEGSSVPPGWKPYRDLEQQLVKVTQELAVTRDAVVRDKTGLAAALVEVVKIAQGYEWMARGEWGSYEWEDHTVETLQKEIGFCLGAIQELAKGALSASGTLAGQAARNELTPNRQLSLALVGMQQKMAQMGRTMSQMQVHCDVAGGAGDWSGIQVVRV